MKICNHCKRVVGDDMKYCPYCGEPIEEQETCVLDGTEAEPIEDSKRTGQVENNPKKVGVVIGLSALVPLGVLLVVVGMLSHWAISVVGGICLGTAWSIYKYYLKR